MSELYERFEKTAFKQLLDRNLRKGRITEEEYERYTAQHDAADITFTDNGVGFCFNYNENQKSSKVLGGYDYTSESAPDTHVETILFIAGDTIIGMEGHGGGSYIPESFWSDFTRIRKKPPVRPDRDDKPKKLSMIVILLLCILIAIMLLVAASVGTYLFVDSQSDTIKESYTQHDIAASATHPVITPAPTETPTLPPTAAPAATKTPISSSAHRANPSYSVYSDPEFGFSCAYPTHFEKYIDNTAEGRYTLRNSDGTASLRICAENNSTNITLAQSLSMFTMKNPGQIETSRSGGTYYIVKVNDSGICRYRYLVSKNNSLYWFDFTYPKEYEYIYEPYTRHIYESFTVK